MEADSGKLVPESLMTSEKKVLIAGAGPAGACLAQILRKNGIPFEIFERENNLEARRGGGFTLDDALPCMTELLPSDLGDFVSVSCNAAVNAPDEVAFVDGRRGAILARISGESENGRPNSITVGRQKFRHWLIQKLDVKTNRRFERYVEDEAGVTACFTDGTSVRGALLVGADGAHSVVRKQMLGNPKLGLHSTVPICGDLVLSRHILKRTRAIAKEAFVTYTPSAHLMLMQIDINADETEAKYWWFVAFRSDDAARDTAWVQQANKASLFRKSLSVIRGMPEILVEAVHSGGPSSPWTQQIRFTEFVPPTTLPRGRVTLMGDAAHNTTPYGGHGVNVSL